jgi:hypothetical protein
MFAQEATTTEPRDLSKWDLICYCITSVGTPHFAVKADTNGRILYAAQKGLTRKQIEEAVPSPALTSQLGLLRDWRMLKRTGDIYTTNIPVLGPEKMDQMRARMTEMARGIEP